MKYGSSYKTLIFYINCQTTIAFRAIRSLHFYHLWVHHTVNHIFPLHMWVRHIYDFPFRLVRHLLRSVTVAFRATRILSTVGADISVDRSFQSYQNPDYFKS